MNLIVIDIGSSSVRAILFEAETFRTLHSASRPYSFVTDPPGAAEVDAIMLRGLVESCLDNVLAHPSAQSIQAVGMATFVGNVLGVDEAGQPATPIYAYADMRSAPQVESLREQIDPVEVHQRTGCPHHTVYLPGRLRWLHEQGRTAGLRWLDVGTYLYETWFARRVPGSYSVASWNGLLDRAALTWDAAWLRLLDIPLTSLPELADYTAFQAGLSEAYAPRWPVLRDVPFFLAVGDGAAANVGMGALGSHRIGLTVGTTSAIRRVSNEPLPDVPSGLWSYRLDAAHHVTGGALIEGGNIFQWVRETFHLPPGAEEEWAKRPPDAHGLTFLPMLGGERSPGWNTRATGTITGLRLSTTPLDLLQAALEGVAVRLSILLDQVAAQDERVMAGGGALAASPAWTQVITDALDRPVWLVAEHEPTARGTAILAWRALGRCELDSYPPPIAQVFEPDAGRARLFRAAQARYKDFYAQLYGA